LSVDWTSPIVLTDLPESLYFAQSSALVFSIKREVLWSTLDRSERAKASVQKQGCIGEVVKGSNLFS
jgi:hypothetical protein